MQKPARSRCELRPYERSGLLHYDYVTKYMLDLLNLKAAHQKFKVNSFNHPLTQTVLKQTVNSILTGQ